MLKVAATELWGPPKALISGFPGGGVGGGGGCPGPAFRGMLEPANPLEKAQVQLIKPGRALESRGPFVVCAGAGGAAWLADV